jgi:hypothetical protein
MKTTKELRAVSVAVDGPYVVLRLSDGTHVLRDFSLVRGPALDAIHSRRGCLKAGVRIDGSRLVWKGDIDFELALILWGYPRGRRVRPLQRALVGAGGTLIPAPLVRA